MTVGGMLTYVEESSQDGPAGVVYPEGEYAGKCGFVGDGDHDVVFLRLDGGLDNCGFE
jgi:hypothetical protein